MKKHLLKPPPNDAELLFLPSLKEVAEALDKQPVSLTAHQPYFFNPGVSLKFLLLQKLARQKKFLFVDSDRLDLKANIPSSRGVRRLSCIESQDILLDFPTPDKKVFDLFFERAEEALSSGDSLRQAQKHFLRFKEIFYARLTRPLLKEALVESFLSFYGLEDDYSFVSDLVAGDDFKDFFERIYKDADAFRETFNRSLEAYGREFSFRFKNFPFPKLEKGELPFWLVRKGKRQRLFKDTFDQAKPGAMILPRAATLTIFVRLYKSDLFVHGTGGANYEWVSDRLIEEFFAKKPPAYAVVSGTFLIEGFQERDMPYFLFDPEKVKAVFNDLAALQTARL